MSLGTKLVTSFLGCGLVPLGIVAFISYGTANEGMSNISTAGARDLEQKAYSQLVALRDVKKGQIEQYFTERRGDIGSLARAGEQVSVVPKTSGTTENMKQLLGALKAGGSAHLTGTIASSIGLPYGVGATLGAIAPATFDRLIMTKKGQQYLANQLVKGGNGSIAPDYARKIIAALAAQSQIEGQ